MHGFLPHRARGVERRSPADREHSGVVSAFVWRAVAVSLAAARMLTGGTHPGGIVFRDRRVVVIMPAYNAAKTLRRTYDEVMAQEIVDLVIVVDDASRDDTVAIARTLPHTRVEIHPRNRGYGANQKTLYRLALEERADIVIMVHPDYQYTPKLIPAMASLIGNGLYPACWARGSSAVTRGAAACRGGATCRTGS
jgi:hypothetical protein